MKRMFIAGLAILSGMALSSDAAAIKVFDNGGGDCLFSNPLNWNDDTLPVNSDRIDVRKGTSASNPALVDPAWNLVNPGNSYFQDVSGAHITVQSNATLVTAILYLGDGAGQSGFLTVKSGGTFRSTAANSASLFIGRNPGEGHLTVDTGAAVAGPNLIVGPFGVFEYKADTDSLASVPLYGDTAWVMDGLLKIDLTSLTSGGTFVLMSHQNDNNPGALLKGGLRDWLNGGSGSRSGTGDGIFNVNGTNVFQVTGSAGKEWTLNYSETSGAGVLSLILKKERSSAGEEKTSGEPALSMLPAGDVKPQGWIWKQMDADLREGLVAKYSKVSNMVNNEIFTKRNGTLADPYAYPGGAAPRSWWVGEVEGNQLDALVRMAFLTDNAEYKEKVKKQIDDILEAQKNDPEGYIGVYVPKDRFALRTEKNNNGELWTQEHVFQAMLAYYEYTKDKTVLAAVEKAVDCTLKHYEGKEVFYQGSGVSHGIAFVDTLEWLYRLTDDPKYVRAMQWLYDDFSKKGKADADLSYDEMGNPDLLWFSHAPHTVEGMHAPVIAYAMTHDEKYKAAAGNVLMKYDRHDNPGGGVVGDEGIEKRMGSSMLPDEYCTKVSALMALNRIETWTGNLDTGRRAEKIVLNSAQGARFQPVNTAVRYLSHDNQHDASNHSYGGRYLYSPMHAAPCCATIASRLMPYYIEGMWFANQAKNELVANYYGPNRVDTLVAGRKISLVEDTVYPFSDQIRFVFDSDADTTLILRKPPHSGDVKVVAAGAAVEMTLETISIRGSWKKGAEISVNFDFKPQLVCEPNLTNSCYYAWGPLLFSLPLGEDRKAIKEYEAQEGNPSGCFLWEIKPVHPEFWDYRIDSQEPFVKVDLSGGSFDTPYADSPIGLKGKMVDGSGNKTDVVLTPEGSSLLRRTTFPDYSKPVVGPQNEWIKQKGINPDGTMIETGEKKKSGQ